MSDLVWQEYAADTPRFTGASSGLLIEPPATNLVRNPRCEGATAGVIGSGGAAPTHWTITAGDTSTVTINGITSVNGVQCLDVTVAASGSGTATTISFDTLTVSSSTSYISSVFLALSSGSFSTFSSAVFRHNITAVTPNTATTNDISDLTSTLVRRSISAATLADTTTMLPELALTPSGSGSVRLLIGWPNTCTGTLLAAPVLPLVGSPATSTKGLDTVTRTLSSLGISSTGACTILWKGYLVHQKVGFSAPFMQIDSGANTTRWIVDSRALDGLFRFSSNSAAVTNLSHHTAGVVFTLGLTLDGAGNGYCSMNGTTAVLRTGPFAGLTTLRIAASATGGGIHMVTNKLEVIPSSVSTAVLESRTGSF